MSRCNTEGRATNIAHDSDCGESDDACWVRSGWTLGGLLVGFVGCPWLSFGCRGRCIVVVVVLVTRVCGHHGPRGALPLFGHVG